MSDEELKQLHHGVLAPPLDYDLHRPCRLPTSNFPLALQNMVFPIAVGPIERLLEISTELTNATYEPSRSL